MSLEELYKNDLLNRYASYTFTETAVEDHWKITFKNASSVVVAEVTKQSKEDAYKLIRENLIGDAIIALCYTVAGLPAVGIGGGIIFVSDEIGGPTLAFSDGTNWRRVQDTAIVA